MSDCLRINDMTLKTRPGHLSLVPCRPTVPTIFKCPFCHHDDAVECKLDMKVKLGSLNCRICSAAFQTQIHCESPSHWLIDACEILARSDLSEGRGGQGRRLDVELLVHFGLEN